MEHKSKHGNNRLVIEKAMRENNKRSQKVLFLPTIPQNKTLNPAILDRQENECERESSDIYILVDGLIGAIEMSTDSSKKPSDALFSALKKWRDQLYRQST